MSKIHVVIQLTSPLHLDYPATPAQQKEAAKEWGFPDGTLFSPTFMKSIVTPTGLVSVPAVPANGLRGALRRKAADRLLARLCAGDQSVPASLYIGLQCGASSGRPDSTPLSIEELLRANKNVYMGTFGGGARILESSYRPSDIVPIHEATVKAWVVPSLFNEPEFAGHVVRGVSTRELIEHYYSVRRDDLLQTRGHGEQSKFVRVEDIAVYQANAIQQNAERKADKENVEKETVSNMLTVQVVKAGTPMHFSIELLPTDGDELDERIGLMLLGLQDMVRENRLGARGRSGFGQYRVRHVILERDHDQQTLVFDDAELYEGDQFHLPPELGTYVDAAETALDRITLQEMVGYYTDFSAEKKAASKAAKATKAAPSNAKVAEVTA